MSGYSIKVPPESRHAIREAASIVRLTLEKKKGSSSLYLPIIEMLEFTLPKLDNEFNFEVLPKSVMQSNHGLTIPEQKTIMLREDVYERALDGCGRDRMTAAHELGHYILHSNLEVTLARTNEELRPFEDSEWQANCFGGEILMPYTKKDLLIGKTPQEIADLCGVSLEAATYQSKFFR
ncbi:ImmA/IrrE family metallo-endopeptidase [Pseudoalteromonas sp. ZZD1]|uniref:ImmA/IrrE family metallo-endopeptidase n=1 Tax=Pseudoalteromonas sp. ZZD1 TaxID=3139395 RepID=UPI003BAD975B